jgi:Leucine-rich repeat (LRR) protein
MKKLYTLFVIALIGFGGKAQIVNIPDANFKAKLLAASATVHVASTQTPDGVGSVSTYTKIDTNNDGEIQLSEALAIKCLYVGSSTTISDLTGIQSFSNLQSLYCTNNALTTLNVSNLVNLEYLFCYNNAISNLNITNCTGLSRLDCYSNQLTSLDISTSPYLLTLDCNSNLIQNLNISNCNALTYLDCGGNQLTSLDVSNRPNLNYLSCGDNLITSLNITNDLALGDLNFLSNQIESINIDPFINIQSLKMGTNPFTSPVNLSTLNSLNYLDARNINDVAMFPLNNNSMPLLTNLNVLVTDGSNIGNFNYSLLPNLQQLLCRNTGLTSLNTIPTNVSVLVTEKNQLTTVDLTPFINLTFFQSYDNPITSVVLGNHPDLNYLNLGKSQLTSIDVSGLPALNNFTVKNCPLLTSANIKNGLLTNLSFQNCPNLLYICANESAINNIQTAIATNAASYNGNPNCHVNTYCTFEPGGAFYTIQGQHRWDTTNNGCDSSDFLFPNMKFTISDGTTNTTLISGNDGSYHYDVPAGTYTVTPVIENPSYFTVTPSNTGNIVFPTAASPFVRDFCVTANGAHNDLEVTIIPIVPARPGSDAKYKIIYKNKGTTMQNGTVSLNFPDSIEDFVISSPNFDSQSTNTLNWNFSNLMPLENREITVTFNINSTVESPPVYAGDVINYSATITGTLTDVFPSDNTFSLQQTAVNSYDPNDKTCVEGSTIAPSMVGKYVHYVIRFENTGTADALNIVVRDVIDTTKYDISSLIAQTGSAPFTTRIINTNQVEFIFENINLPFNEGNNTGYVAFKIKTKAALVVGDTFSNTANIYFDYNLPIVTNTYTTTVATLVAQDFEFGNLFTLSPVPAKNSLTITSKQEVVMSSVSIYNTLGQLVQVNTNPNQTIDVSDLKTGSYFIKIITDKGTTGSKFIKE